MSTPQEKAAQTKEKRRKEAEKREREAVQREREEARLREQEWERRHTELPKYQSEKAAYELLLSEVEGLYDELDKLAKKAPNEPMTTLQLKIVNSFLRKSKKLLLDDPIIDEVEIFVSAGDNPEYRDVVTVLRQIKQGLGRYKVKNSFLFSHGFTLELKEHDLDQEEPSDFFSVESDAESEPEDGTTK
jgi:poly-D-alanine transfer protein DltD